MRSLAESSLGNRDLVESGTTSENRIRGSGRSQGSAGPVAETLRNLILLRDL